MFSSRPRVDSPSNLQKDVQIQSGLTHFFGARLKVEVTPEQSANLSAMLVFILIKNWAFQPLRRPQIPALPQTGSGTPGGTAIDAFLDAERRKIAVITNPLVDRRNLIRRLTLTLTGLPPTREEIRECLLQTAVYCGAPAALDAFRTAREVFAEMEAEE